MKFSIVIPASDSIATLPAAVESALAANYKDITVYVSDNASTDGSKEYLLSLRDERLRVCCNDIRVDKTENWNRAFRGAPQCDYFIMLHSDDVIYSETVEKIADAIQDDPTAVLIFGNHNILSLDGGSRFNKRMWPFRYTCSGRSFDRLQALNNAVSIVAPTFPYSAYFRVGGFSSDYQFYQDMEFYRNIAQFGLVMYIPVKFGDNRSAPDRPRARLKFYIEEHRWVPSVASSWGCFSSWIHSSWSSAAVLSLARYSPELVEEYRAAVGASSGGGAISRRFVFPRVLAQSIYKMFLSARQFLSV